MSEWFFWPWGTQPLITRGFPSSRPLRIAFFRPSSEGPFTVQLFRSHRSAARGDSVEGEGGEGGGGRRVVIRSRWTYTCYTVASSCKHARHVLSIASVMGTAPGLQVHRLRAWYKALGYRFLSLKDFIPLVSSLAQRSRKENSFLMRSSRRSTVSRSNTVLNVTYHCTERNAESALCHVLCACVQITLRMRTNHPTTKTSVMCITHSYTPLH